MPGKRVHVNITIDPELLVEIDRDARRMYLNRSQYLEYCARRMIEARRFMKGQPELQRKMVELQDALSDIAMNSDRDFAGLFGQTSLADLDPAEKPAKGRKK